MQDYKQLLVWHKARALTVAVSQIAHRIHDAKAPKLRSQLIRAVLSIGSNICEGAGRSTRPDFARFVSMAASSTNEVENHLTSALDLRFIQEYEFQRLVDQVTEIRRMLCGLQRTLLRRDQEEKLRKRRGPKPSTDA